MVQTGFGHSKAIDTGMEINDVRGKISTLWIYL